MHLYAERDITSAAERLQVTVEPRWLPSRSGDERAVQERALSIP